ncbi:MAG: hypothetical protein MH252_04690 [Thermosynechococcaceae cyanobacterium MS004]|nr:hypothetical protein [Thermosynechococcaceae cyanobacterium MS004]
MGNDARQLYRSIRLCNWILSTAVKIRVLNKVAIALAPLCRQQEQTGNCPSQQLSNPLI